ncbi:P-loop containing nucleoside triphosphate hydrolase protein [Clathrospora elynae]|uniref:P-loop containing nucleoside triphosphate hydrolase protein n=1 Tax=Clathrospora elynae TaxID=706981 RepID=A0A6A5SJR4_9PLEO|nr:P-loop containing nucleoside triphosphate hydrolase protein [Clathrospora elynae]
MPPPVMPGHPQKGQRCNIKNVYRVPDEKNPNKYHWIDEKSLQYGLIDDKTKMKKTREAFAINVYHKLNEEDDEWYVHEVPINITLLHSALGKILEGYPGLTQHRLMSFAPPFLPFIHRWQALLSYENNLDAMSETKNHLQLLQQVLHPLLEESFKTIRDVDLSPMTDEQCLHATPTVKCFKIEKKKWEKLAVAKIHEIPWAEKAFDSLVLDHSEKGLMLALVDRDQFTQGRPFDDFIGGKGQGMIMLLCGPPGVGKTLTAETVSEHLRRPLYKLGAGDLGTDARHVEASLDKALKLCGHFGAVLLIDEVDVFMEARTSNNLQRNELVSVFLRLLEYYNGIMILTTNRMRSIDSAFESRIDITLTYNSLTEVDRQQVWRNFLATMDPKDFDIGETDLMKLAKWDFNGRQLKSAIKTARILASKKWEPLNIQHLNVVLITDFPSLSL